MSILHIMISVAKIALKDLIYLRKEEWDGALILSTTGQAAEKSPKVGTVYSR